MHIIARYLVAETLKSQLAVFFVLMAIFVTQKFVRVLAEVTSGDIPAALLISFLGLKLPALAIIIFPLSLFLGVLIAHGRFYVDSEMTVMQACGVSEWYVTRVMLVISVFMAILVAVFTMWLSPLAAEAEYQLEERVVAESGLGSIIPGRFQPTANDKGVMFVHNQGLEKNQLEGVFVAIQGNADKQQNGSELQLVYAKAGTVETAADGTDQLQLRDGKQYLGSKDALDFNVVSFSDYRVTVDEKGVEKRSRDLEAYSMQQLLQDTSTDAKAELQWRLAIPLSIPFLILIAVPLSSVNPRQGRFGRVGPALLLYLAYSLLLMAGKKALASEQIPISIGLWWVHGIMFIVGAVLLSEERSFGIKLRSLIKGRV